MWGLNFFVGGDYGILTDMVLEKGTSFDVGYMDFMDGRKIHGEKE